MKDSSLVTTRGGVYESFDKNLSPYELNLQLHATSTSNPLVLTVNTDLSVSSSTKFDYYISGNISFAFSRKLVNRRYYAYGYSASIGVGSITNNSTGLNFTQFLAKNGSYTYFVIGFTNSNYSGKTLVIEDPSNVNNKFTCKISYHNDFECYGYYNKATDAQDASKFPFNIFYGSSGINYSFKIKITN